MKRLQKSIKIAGMVGAALAGITVTAPAMAVPPQCVRDAWYYADHTSGTNDRDDPAWIEAFSYYMHLTNCEVATCHEGQPCFWPE